MKTKGKRMREKTSFPIISVFPDFCFSTVGKILKLKSECRGNKGMNETNVFRVSLERRRRGRGCLYREGVQEDRDKEIVLVNLN